MSRKSDAQINSRIRELEGEKDNINKADIQKDMILFEIHVLKWVLED